MTWKASNINDGFGRFYKSHLIGRFLGNTPEKLSKTSMMTIEIFSSGFCQGLQGLKGFSLPNLKKYLVEFGGNF